MSGPQPPAIPVFYAGQPAVPQLNVMADAFGFLLGKPAFRARRTTAGTITRTAYTPVPWDAVDEDPYGGWGPSQTPAQSATRYVVQAPGWYAVTGTVSASGPGASGTILALYLGVNGASPTGQPVGGPGWELPEIPLPTGAGDPKALGGYWETYCRAGDYIELVAYLSGEPSSDWSWQTATTAQTNVSILWMGV